MSALVEELKRHSLHVGVYDGLWSNYCTDFRKEYIAVLTAQGITPCTHQTPKRDTKEEAIADYWAHMEDVVKPYLVATPHKAGQTTVPVAEDSAPNDILNLTLVAPVDDDQPPTALVRFQALDGLVIGVRAEQWRALDKPTRLTVHRMDIQHHVNTGHFSIGDDPVSVTNPEGTT